MSNKENQVNENIEVNNDKSENSKNNNKKEEKGNDNTDLSLEKFYEERQSFFEESICSRNSQPILNKNNNLKRQIAKGKKYSSGINLDQYSNHKNVEPNKIISYSQYKSEYGSNNNLKNDQNNLKILDVLLSNSNVNSKNPTNKNSGSIKNEQEENNNNNNNNNKNNNNNNNILINDEQLKNNNYNTCNKNIINCIQENSNITSNRNDCKIQISNNPILNNKNQNIKQKSIPKSKEKNNTKHKSTTYNSFRNKTSSNAINNLKTETIGSKNKIDKIDKTENKKKINTNRYKRNNEKKCPNKNIQIVTSITNEIDNPLTTSNKPTTYRSNTKSYSSKPKLKSDKKKNPIPTDSMKNDQPTLIIQNTTSTTIQNNQLTESSNIYNNNNINNLQSNKSDQNLNCNDTEQKEIIQDENDTTLANYQANINNQKNQININNKSARSCKTIRKINIENSQNSPVNKTSYAILTENDIYTRCKIYKENSKKKLEKLKEEMGKDELKECSFNPNISLTTRKPPKLNQTCTNISHNSFNEFYIKNLSWKNKRDNTVEKQIRYYEEKRCEECSFQPNYKDRNKQNELKNELKNKSKDYIYNRNITWLKKVNDNKEKYKLKQIKSLDDEIKEIQNKNKIYGEVKLGVKESNNNLGYVCNGFRKGWDKRRDNIDNICKTENNDVKGKGKIIVNIGDGVEEGRGLDGKGKLNNKELNEIKLLLSSLKDTLDMNKKIKKLNNI